MPGFREFQALIVREAAALIAGMNEADYAAVRHNTATLLGLAEDEPAPEPRQPQPRQQTLMKLLFGLSEILESVDNLRNIVVYVRRFPYARSGIEKGAHLRYHVENYLNELYILEKRMEAYLTVITRQYRLDSRASRIARVTKTIRDSFATALSGAIEARGAHVHERRYSDRELDRLRTFEIMKDHDARWAGLYDLTYRQTRETRLKWITETNQLIEGLLDVYFEYLLKLLLD